ncbi:Mur ligase family protein, partial [Streptococcus pyogenes]
YAVIDEEAYRKDERFVLVKDVLTALQELANYHRKKLGIPVLSITGSNGKTTTKELINAVLSKKYKTYATKGNLNNH